MAAEEGPGAAPPPVPEPDADGLIQGIPADLALKAIAVEGKEPLNGVVLRGDKHPVGVRSFEEIACGIYRRAARHDRDRCLRIIAMARAADRRLGEVPPEVSRLLRPTASDFAFRELPDWGVPECPAWVIEDVVAYYRAVEPPDATDPPLGEEPPEDGGEVDPALLAQARRAISLLAPELHHVLAKVAPAAARFSLP